MNAAVNIAAFRNGYAHITMVAGHEDMWFAIRTLGNRGSGFTAEDLARASGATAGAAGFYLAKLARTGIAVHMGQGTDRSAIYAVAKMSNTPVVLDDRGQPSKDYTLRHALWNAVRMLRQFTVGDLWLKVRDILSVTKAIVLKFITRLTVAGYLSELEGKGRHGDPEFGLHPRMDTGRLPPRFCEADLVYDPNKREFYGRAQAHEVAL